MIVLWRDGCGRSTGRWRRGWVMPVEMGRELGSCSRDYAVGVAARIMAATAVEPDPVRRGLLADQIVEIYRIHPTAEIALRLARALFNATVDEPDPVRCAALADQIEKLHRLHLTAEIALEQAKALFNTKVVVEEPVLGAALVEQIGEIYRLHPTGEIGEVLELARRGPETQV